MSRDQWWCSIWDSGGAVALTYPWSMPIGCEHLPLTPPPICLENGETKHLSCGNRTARHGKWWNIFMWWNMFMAIIGKASTHRQFSELNRLRARSSNNPQHQRDSITTRQLPRNQSQQFSSSQPMNRNCAKLVGDSDRPKNLSYIAFVFKSTSIFYAQKLCIGDMIPTHPRRRVTFGLGEDQISLSPGLEDPKLARHQQTKHVSKPSAKE
jgi:hypothetical protein